MKNQKSSRSTVSISSSSVEISYLAEMQSIDGGAFSIQTSAQFLTSITGDSGLHCGSPVCSNESIPMLFGLLGDKRITFLNSRPGTTVFKVHDEVETESIKILADYQVQGWGIVSPEAEVRGVRFHVTGLQRWAEAENSERGWAPSAPDSSVIVPRVLGGGVLSLVHRVGPEDSLSLEWLIDDPVELIYVLDQFTKRVTEFFRLCSIYPVSVDNLQVQVSNDLWRDVSGVDLYSTGVVAPETCVPPIGLAHVGLEGLIAWLESAKTYGDESYVITESIGKNSPMPGDFLNLAAAADGIHQSVFGKKKPGTNRSYWYKERLLKLVEDANAQGMKVTDDIEAWVDEISDLRNAHAHKMQAQVSLAERKRHAILYMSLSWVCYVALMLRSEIHVGNLGAHFDVYENCSWEDFKVHQNGKHEEPGCIHCDPAVGGSPKAPPTP